MKHHKTMTNCLMAAILFAGLTTSFSFAQTASQNTDLATPAVATPEAPATAVAIVPSPAWERILVAIINSDAAMTLLGGLFAWLVAWMFTKKPAWKQYEGMIITAIKTAEKLAIPDGTTNTGLLKAKAAADSFTTQYTEHYGAPPTAAVIDLVKSAIPIVHDNLDAKGTL